MSDNIHELTTQSAVDALIAGEVITWPTEAVWGLGCDPQNEQAVKKLLQIKKRGQSRGLILIAADFEQVQNLVKPVSVCEMGRALSSWPGPVTWLFPAREDTPRWLTGAHATLAVRVTDHPLSRRLCRYFGAPLVSTSANPSGQPAAKNLAEVRAYFSPDHLGGYLDGELGQQLQVSQIRDLASDKVIRN